MDVDDVEKVLARFQKGLTKAEGPGAKYCIKSCNSERRAFCVAFLTAQAVATKGASSVATPVQFIYRLDFQCGQKVVLWDVWWPNKR